MRRGRRSALSSCIMRSSFWDGHYYELPRVKEAAGGPGRDLQLQAWCSPSAGIYHPQDAAAGRRRVETASAASGGRPVERTAGGGRSSASKARYPRSGLRAIKRKRHLLAAPCRLKDFYTAAVPSSVGHSQRIGNAGYQAGRRWSASGTIRLIGAGMVVTAEQLRFLIVADYLPRAPVAGAGTARP